VLGVEATPADVLDADLAADDAVAAQIESIMATRPAEEWARRLAAAGVPATVAETSGFDEWLEDRELLIPMDHPSFGAYWRLGPKLSLSGSNPVLAPPCAAGEQSCDLL
ncbi:MAG TPA: CoA transferase, partial [Ilumatobacteraceae bacterium]|nr:CoA transferase [Ilumatobacteraceae bacterium]